MGCWGAKRTCCCAAACSEAGGSIKIHKNFKEALTIKAGIF